MQVIRIPKLKPSRFLIMEGISPAKLRTWPNALVNLKKIGVNWVIYNNPRLITGTDLQPGQDIKNLKYAGFNLATSLNVTDTYLKDKPSWAIDMNGKPLEPRLMGRPPCCTKRGEGYKKMVANANKYLAAGITGFVFDDEGSTTCYCDDCVNAFKQYLSANAPDVPFVDPRVFMKSPEKHPKLRVLWYDFSRWSYANIVLDLRTELLAYMKKKGMQTNNLLLYDEGITIIDNAIDLIREQQKMESPKNLFALYGKAFDYYGEQIYINCYGWWWKYKGLPNLGGDRQGRLTTNCRPCGLKQMPVVGAELTYMDSMNDYQPHAVLKCLLLELACAGISGYHIYPFGDIDLMDMKCMNEALSIIQKVEDIVINGLPEDWAEANKGNVRTLKWGQDRLICVSEYSTFENVPVIIKVTCPANEDLSVIDVETGKQIANLSAGKGAFEVRLGRERCKVLYIGKKIKKLTKNYLMHIRRIH